VLDQLEGGHADQFVVPVDGDLVVAGRGHFNFAGAQVEVEELLVLALAYLNLDVLWLFGQRDAA